MKPILWLLISKASLPKTLHICIDLRCIIVPLWQQRELYLASGALGMESWVWGNGWESPNVWELLIPDLERDGTVINRDTIWSASRVKCCLSKGARENAGYGKCFCVLKNESWNCIRIYTEKCSVPCTHRALMILAILSIILQHKPFNNGSWGLPVCSKGQVHKLLMEYRWRAAGSRYCGALKQTTYTSMSRVARYTLLSAGRGDRREFKTTEASKLTTLLRLRSLCASIQAESHFTT